MFSGKNVEVRKGPGLGVAVDRDKLAQYAEQYREFGGYAYDRDPGRDDWYSIFPERRYADPHLKTVAPQAGAS